MSLRSDFHVVTKNDPKTLFELSKSGQKIINRKIWKIAEMT